MLPTYPDRKDTILMIFVGIVSHIVAGFYLAQLEAALQLFRSAIFVYLK